MDKDRRKFKRFDAYMSVKCAPNEDISRNFNIGLTKDVSRDGVCVNSNDDIKKGTVVTLEIDLPDDPRPIKTAGKIMWAKTTNKDEGVDYGIQFTNIDPIDKFRVLDYAYNHWLETKVNDFSDPEEVSELD